VVRHPTLVALLEAYYKDAITEAALKMAEIPEGAQLLADSSVRFPTILMGNVYVLPGVPEIFRRKFDALRERFRDQPIFLKNVFVSVGEGSIADHLNALVREYPELLCGSYPEFSNPEYKVKITLESRDLAFLDRALAELLTRLPADSIVRVG
jgi:molybdopterin-biosynthesis enzyme MoeA-like protein